MWCRGSGKAYELLGRLASGCVRLVALIVGEAASGLSGLSGGGGERVSAWRGVARLGTKECIFFQCLCCWRGDGTLQRHEFIPGTGTAGNYEGLDGGQRKTGRGKGRERGARMAAWRHRSHLERVACRATSASTTGRAPASRRRTIWGSRTEASSSLRGCLRPGQVICWSVFAGKPTRRAADADSLAESSGRLPIHGS